jgi:hypothetical protein
MGFYKLPLPTFWLIMPLGLAGLAVTLAALGGFASPDPAVRHLRSTLVCSCQCPLPAAGHGRRHPPGRRRPGPAVAGLARAGARTPALWGAFFAGGLVLAFLPLTGVGDLSAYYNTQAFVGKGAGAYQGGGDWWRRSGRRMAASVNMPGCFWPGSI